MMRIYEKIKSAWNKIDQFQRIKIISNTAIISGVFTIIIALLMLLNYWQIKTSDPLDSESLKVLVERMREEPNNEMLKNDIRNLDLLARKAFFNGQWQVRTGRYLMLFGAILFVASLRYYFSLKSEIPIPETVSSGDIRERDLSQRWIAITGGLVFLLAFISSFAVMNHLKIYQPDESTSFSPDQSKEDEIEVVEIIVPQEQDEVAEEKTTKQSEVDEQLPEIKEEPGSEPEKSQITFSKADLPRFPSLEEIRANHNSFRGPLGCGISYAKNVPVDWTGAEGKNVIWKIQLSKPGYNSPVIWNDRLFLAGGDKTVRKVYCLDKNTGRIIWEKEVTGIEGSPAEMPKVTDDTGLSAPTVTTDGSRVIAIFATGDIIAFASDGSRLWGRNLGLPDNHYGYASSLVTWGGNVFIQFDSNKGGRVLSLNVLTGETNWDTRRNTRISWASPILAEIDGKMQLVMSADPLVAGYDINDGKELWSVECMFGEVGPSPAFSDGLVFAANEYARLVAIKPGTNPSIVWQDDEYLPEVASPVAFKGLLFVATSYGVVVCYDASSGEKYWEHEFNQGFYSSPVIADNKLYAMDVNGIMHIFKVSSQKELISEPELGEKSVATPAFSDGRIYLRGEKFVYCIGEK